MISLSDTISSDHNNKFMLVHGPSRVSLSKGRLEVFGKSFMRDKSFIVPHGKTVPVILGTETRISDIQVQSGIQGALEPVSKNPVPMLWDELATRLVKLEKGLWMIIGGPDSGKTGFITFLVNKCLQEQRKVAIIDSDLGQSNIGPPTAIGLALPKTPEILLSDHKMHTGYFVGSTSPRGHLLQTCCGVRKLVDIAYNKGAEIILLDTSGYIADPTARMLKYHKALLVAPSAILAIQYSNELEHILNALNGLCHIEYLSPPVSIQVKNYDDRVIYRERMFKKTFANARSVTFSSDVALLGTSLGFGESLTDYSKLDMLLNTKVSWAQRIGNTLFIVIQTRFLKENIQEIKEEFNVSFINIIDCRDLKGLIVGLLAEGHKFLALGILQDIQLGKKIIVRTTYSQPELVNFITLGRIRLSPEGQQLGRIPVGAI